MAQWPELLLLVGFLDGFLRLGSLLVLLRETLDAACRIQQLLLAGEEGMAVRTDLDAQQSALDRGASRERVPASAVHRHGMVVRMDIGFHGGLLPSGRSAQPPAWCQDYSRVAWSADNLQSYAIPGILAKRAAPAARNPLSRKPIGMSCPDLEKRSASGLRFSGGRGFSPDVQEVLRRAFKP